MAVRTSQGQLPLRLDRAKAPCTVQSFLHLARHGFYDRTVCHRLTAYPTLKVLQCGDPTGTGEGGPGYKYKDELPVDLPPAPTDPTGARRLYGRGLLAMANAGPDTNGSQFFVVYGDSALRPKHGVRYGRPRRPGNTRQDRRRGNRADRGGPGTGRWHTRAADRAAPCPAVLPVLTPCGPARRMPDRFRVDTSSGAGPRPASARPGRPRRVLPPGPKAGQPRAGISARARTVGDRRWLPL
ncbi:peptidylprolyl isomerase [Streptomyces erythrochromogenes]